MSSINNAALSQAGFHASLRLQHDRFLSAEDS
jgi:hypothetical protein